MMAATKSGVSVPVTQMLSAKHDNKTIARWLEALVDVVGCTPKEVVIDESASLLLASIKAFTQFSSVNNYLNRCHLLLELSQLKERNIEKPNCFIRHDISHIIKNLIKAKIFEKCDKRVKKWYLFAMGSLFALQDFQTVKNIIRDILILALCPLESKITESSRKNLTHLIQYHNVENMYTKNAIPDDSEETDVFNVLTDEHDEIASKNSVKKVINWYEEIKGVVLQITVTNRNNDDKANFYFFPSFVPFLDKMIYKMPTWSAIMKDIFQSPNVNVSSSNCESEFKYIKRYLFKNTKKMRVDKFLFGHINDIIGRLLLAMADLNSYESIQKGFYNIIHILLFKYLIIFVLILST